MAGLAAGEGTLEGMVSDQFNYMPPVLAEIVNKDEMETPCRGV
jgi:hypothetical protein